MGNNQECQYWALLQGTTSTKTAQLAAAVAQRNWDEVLSGSLRGNSDDDWWKWSLQSCKVTVKKLNFWLFRWTAGTCKQNRLRRELQHMALSTQPLENALVLEKILNTFHVFQRKRIIALMTYNNQIVETTWNNTSPDKVKGEKRNWCTETWKRTSHLQWKIAADLMFFFYIAWNGIHNFLQMEISV